ncbi:MAG: chemotaxis protein [Desulfovibrio sp.]|jgi:two-component system chemotaxis response regulator CheV|nr:chemotaxis protein [Desulfovibrio sp.]
MSQSNILIESGTNELEIVEFHIDEPNYSGHYGINVAKVVEIIRLQPVTAMPQMRHPSVLGAFPHRDGKVVPLVDLASYLGKTKVPTNEAKIIVTELNGIVTAFQVSGVNRIHRLSWRDVEEPGLFLQNMSHNSITGVVRLDSRVVFLLDIENIVADIDPSLAVHLSHTEEYSAGDGEIYTILHADDSGSIRHLVKNLLEKSGPFNVVQAVSGEDAWNLLNGLKRKAQDEAKQVRDFVQAVISDIEMPQMDGFALCKKIKEDPELKKLPVALFSSIISQALAHKGVSVGADAQFTKPDLEHLREKLLELIQKTEVRVS